MSGRCWLCHCNIRETQLNTGCPKRKRKKNNKNKINAACCKNWYSIFDSVLKGTHKDLVLLMRTHFSGAIFLRRFLEFC